MNWSFVRREWGAVTFVVAVAIGLLVVPTALYFGNQSATGNAANGAQSTIASPARSATP